MKIQQENLPFRPITLKLETRSEAEALVGIMDKINDCIASAGKDIKPPMLTKAESRLAVEISNAFTECRVRV